jgi:hypothetical protein
MGVRFKLDGSYLCTEDTKMPSSVTWNTTTIANGTHTFSAVARDAGNQSTGDTGHNGISNVAMTVTATYANASETGLDTGLFTITGSLPVTFSDGNIPSNVLFQVCRLTPIL